MKTGTKSCRRWRHHLVEAVCGELTPAHRAELESHLATCADCRQELAGLEETARRCEAALPPRPKASELDVWSRIRPVLDRVERPAGRRLAGRPLVLGYPAAAAGAVALLVLGLWLGSWLGPSLEPSPEVARPEAAVAAASGAELDVAYLRYLERATPLLLAVANRTTGGTAVASSSASISESVDSTAERRLAERLADDAGRLRQQLEDEGRRRQAALVADLGIVFLQMANLSHHEYRRGIELVQATIESRALLFQLSVEEMRHL